MSIYGTKIRECHASMLLIASKHSPRANNVSIHSAEISYCRGSNRGSLGRSVSLMTTDRLSVFISQTLFLNPKGEVTGQSDTESFGFPVSLWSRFLRFPCCARDLRKGSIKAQKNSAHLTRKYNLIGL